MGGDRLLEGPVSVGVARILDKVGFQCLVLRTTFSRTPLDYSLAHRGGRRECGGGLGSRHAL